MILSTLWYLLCLSLSAQDLNGDVWRDVSCEHLYHQNKTRSTTLNKTVQSKALKNNSNTQWLSQQCKMFNPSSSRVFHCHTLLLLSVGNRSLKRGLLHLLACWYPIHHQNTSLRSSNNKTRVTETHYDKGQHDTAALRDDTQQEAERQ